MTGRRTAVVAFVLLGLIWGTNFVFMQAAAPYITAGQTTLLRLVFGVIPILILGIATRAFSWWHVRYIHHFAAQGVLAAGFYYYAYAAGTYLLDSGIAGSLSGSIPLFASIAAILIFRTERASFHKVLGVFLGALGVVVVAQPWNAAGIDMSGTLWMLAGSASLGISFGYASRFITPLGIASEATATYQMAIAAGGMFVVTDLHGITAIADDTLALLTVVVGLGIVGTGAAFVCYYLAVNGLGAVTASTATYIPPIVALFIGTVFVNESLTVVTLVGVALILIAAVIVQYRGTKSDANVG